MERPGSDFTHKHQNRLDRLSRGKHFDLLVPTSLDQLLVIMNALFFFYKTSYLNEEVNRSEASHSVGVP